MTKQVAIRTEVDKDIHVAFKMICAKEDITIKEKTAQLVQEYVEQKEKK